MVLAWFQDRPGVMRELARATRDPEALAIELAIRAGHNLLSGLADYDAGKAMGMVALRLGFLNRRGDYCHWCGDLVAVCRCDAGRGNREWAARRRAEKAVTDDEAPGLGGSGTSVVEDKADNLDQH